MVVTYGVLPQSTGTEIFDRRELGKRVKVKRLLQLVAVISFPSKALAQVSVEVITMQRNGRIVPVDPQERKALDAYINCRASVTTALTVMRYLPESRISDRKLSELLYAPGECIKHRTRRLYSPFNFRAPLAEGLLKEVFPGGVQSPRHKHAKIFEVPTVEQLQRLPQEVRAAIAMVQVGECVARASPADVRALLSTEIGSEKEDEAFSAISPHLSSCIPPGDDLKILKHQLRGYLAEGAFRVAVSAQGG